MVGQGGLGWARCGELRTGKLRCDGSRRLRQGPFWYGGSRRSRRGWAGCGMAWSVKAVVVWSGKVRLGGLRSGGQLILTREEYYNGKF